MKLTVSSAEETPTSLKCGTFCASAPTDRKLVTGSASGWAMHLLWPSQMSLNLCRELPVFPCGSICTVQALEDA